MPKMQNQALRGLKDVLKEHYTKNNPESMSFFVSDSPIEDVPDFFPPPPYSSLSTQSGGTSIPTQRPLQKSASPPFAEKTSSPSLAT
jgi:hypothetical protein